MNREFKFYDEIDDLVIRSFMDWDCLSIKTCGPFLFNFITIWMK